MGVRTVIERALAQEHATNVSMAESSTSHPSGAIDPIVEGTPGSVNFDTQDDDVGGTFDDPLKAFLKYCKSVSCACLDFGLNHFSVDLMFIFLPFVN